MQPNGVFSDFISFWKNYANFKGRTPRRGFWMAQLWLALIYIAFGLISAIILAVGSQSLESVLILLFIVYGIMFLFLLATFIPSLAILVRRLHDTGRTAHWLWLTFGPAIAQVVLYVILIFQVVGSLSTASLFYMDRYLSMFAGWMIIFAILGLIQLAAGIVMFVFCCLPTSPNAIGVCTHTGQGGATTRKANTSAPARGNTGYTTYSNTPSQSGAASIICTKGMYANASFAINGGEELVLGRDAAYSHVVIDKNSEKVSRKHVSITFDPGRNCYMCTDLSSNGTYKNDGVRLLANVPTAVARGTVINLGSAQNSFLLK